MQLTHSQCRALRPLAEGVALAVALACSATAAAQEAPPTNAAATDQAADDAERPWELGVEKQQRTSAQRLFREGNTFFEQSRYAQALKKYREALTHWDHPGIHFNATVCLIHLDQPIKALEHLDKALRFGDAPFGSRLHRDALTYQKLLLDRLARVEIRAKQPGVVVTLDGKPAVTGPGKQTIVVEPGEHALVARKEGFITASHEFSVLPGKLTIQRVQLIPAGAPPRLVRRFPRWLPWAVAGAGLVTSAAGGYAYVQAGNNFDDYDAKLADLCPQGCPESDVPSSIADLESRGNRNNKLAVGLFAAGGIATAAGLVMVVMNQPQAMESGPPAIVPVVTPDGAGVSVSIPF